MPYQIHWELPHTVLHLKLTDDVTLQEFVEVDRIITEALGAEGVDETVMLIVDVNDARSVPQSFSQLKASQTYASRYNSRLRHILVVCGGNKLMRLMMLLTFNLCRPSLQFFDTTAQVETFIRQVRRLHTQNNA